MGNVGNDDGLGAIKEAQGFVPYSEAMSQQKVVEKKEYVEQLKKQIRSRLIAAYDSISTDDDIAQCARDIRAMTYENPKVTGENIVELQPLINHVVRMEKMCGHSISFFNASLDDIKKFMKNYEETGDSADLVCAKIMLNYIYYAEQDGVLLMKKFKGSYDSVKDRLAKQSAKDTDTRSVGRPTEYAEL